MLILAATTDKLRAVTSAAATVDVHASFVDFSAGVAAAGRQNTAITTATTTDVVAAPAASTVRNIKSMTIRNKHATLSVDVTLTFDQNSTVFEIAKWTLRAGESVEYSEGNGFTIGYLASPPSPTFSTADQTANAADTYITGSAIAIPAGRPLAIGTILTWKFTITKTGAGTATPIWSVRFGTNGTTADTARNTLTGPAQTGVIDTAFVEIQAIVRGPLSGSGIVAATIDLAHALSATGFANVAHHVGYVASSGFDVTVNPLIAGVSVNPGTAGVWTITQATGTIQNL